MAENNKPIKTYKVGVLTLSVWENEVKDNGFIKSFSFQRAYQTDEGDWNHTQNLRLSDLPKMRVLVEEAYKDQILSEKV